MLFVLEECFTDQSGLVLTFNDLSPIMHEINTEPTGTAQKHVSSIKCVTAYVKPVKIYVTLSITGKEVWTGRIFLVNPEAKKS